MVIEARLAAVHDGLLTLRWDLVCPRCRGAKLTATSLDQLPQGAHCSSCNIDYDRDFTRNIEVTFEPASSVRALGGGSYCLANPLLSEHVKVQQHCSTPVQRSPCPSICPTAIIAQAQPSSRVALRRSPTVAGGRRPGDRADRRRHPLIGNSSARPGQLIARNNGSAARTLVVEDRRWAADALTAHEATTMQAFRDLFAGAVLRPGDQVGISASRFCSHPDTRGSSDLATGSATRASPTVLFKSITRC